MKNWFLLVAVVWISFHILASFVLPHFIPYLGLFPYKEVATDYHLPSYITYLANFDGEHYLFIAHRGYHQYDQAFFSFLSFSYSYAGFTY